MNHLAEVRVEPSRVGLLRRRLLMAASVPIGIIAIGVLYHFPPTEYSWYPGCLFHATTGLHCPGCGGTRCVHALLHGELGQAAAYNLLVLLLLPYLALTAFNAGWETVCGRPAFRLKLPAWTIYVVAIVLTLFWILRNLPFAPFTLLAPHQLGPPL